MLGTGLERFSSSLIAKYRSVAIIPLGLLKSTPSVGLKHIGATAKSQAVSPKP